MGYKIMGWVSYLCVGQSICRHREANTATHVKPHSSPKPNKRGVGNSLHYFLVSTTLCWTGHRSLTAIFAEIPLAIGFDVNKPPSSLTDDSFWPGMGNEIHCRPSLNVYRLQHLIRIELEGAAPKLGLEYVTIVFARSVVSGLHQQSRPLKWPQNT